MNPMPKIVIYKHTQTHSITYDGKDCSAEELASLFSFQTPQLIAFETWEDGRLLLRCILVVRSSEQLADRLKRLAKAQV
jgi:hypothetical protein